MSNKKFLAWVCLLLLIPAVPVISHLYHRKITKQFSNTFKVSPRPRSQAVQTVVSVVVGEKKEVCANFQRDFKVAAEDPARMADLKKLQDWEESACQEWQDVTSLAKEFGYKVVE